MTETKDIWQTRWLALAGRWQKHLASTGLGEIVQAMRQAFTPLAPLAAQILWFAQPGFALFGQSEAIHSLAELLDAHNSSQFAVDSSQSKTNDPDYKP